MKETAEAKQTLADVQARYNDMIKLEKSIRELQEMFMEMAGLVQTQVNSLPCCINGRPLTTYFSEWFMCVRIVGWPNQPNRVSCQQCSGICGKWYQKITYSAQISGRCPQSKLLRPILNCICFTLWLIRVTILEKNLDHHHCRCNCRRYRTNHLL